MGTRKDRPVSFDMPRVERVGDSVKAAAAIATAVADGELTPMEAAELGKVVDCYTHAVETADLAARLTRLEQAQKNRNDHGKCIGSTIEQTRSKDRSSV
jgi:hypothetical protein